MTHPVDLDAEARTKRDLAGRARRLARGMAGEDQDRLERLANEMDDRAAQLEAEAAALRPIMPRTPLVTQRQQVQQQQASDAPDDRNPPAANKSD
jgi:hypothetical protein